MTTSFGAWSPIGDAGAIAPPAPGVLQVRGEALRAYPSGRTAMVLYACTHPDETLSELVRERGAASLARAVARGARWIRFATSSTPAEDHARLMRRFIERFGAPPIANQPASGMLLPE